MKILVTGANGQLGREISKQFAGKHEIILTNSSNLDITNYSQVKEVFCQIRPQAVIHGAAYTNVDGAEKDFNGAFKVNVVGTQNIASQCLEHNAKLVYVSTDYVFDGQSSRAYREYDQPSPLNVYGKTKLLGEEMVRNIIGRHYIVRTAWLYGEGNNFVRTMLKLAQEKNKLQVVNDQVGSPTYTKDLVKVIFQLLGTDAYGVYHASCKGEASWYEFSCKIFELAKKDILVEPIATAGFLRPAQRPKHCVLENYMLEMTVGDSMRHWEEALRDYLGDY